MSLTPAGLWVLFRSSGRGAAPAAACRRQGHRNTMAPPGHAVQTPSSARSTLPVLWPGRLGLPLPPVPPSHSRQRSCLQSPFRIPSWPSYSSWWSSCPHRWWDGPYCLETHNLRGGGALWRGWRWLRRIHISVFTLTTIAAGHKVHAPEAPGHSGRSLWHTVGFRYLVSPAGQHRSFKQIYQ